MLREIKFRGKDAHTGDWVHGNLLCRRDHCPAIIEAYPSGDGDVSYREVPVLEDTVGQYSGLVDGEGNEIHEGDIIVRQKAGHTTSPYEVKYLHGAFGYEMSFFGFMPFAGNDNLSFNPCDKDESILVVGNIYDNPDMVSRPGSHAE